MSRPTSSPARILIQVSLIALVVLLVFSAAKTQEPAKPSTDSVRVIVHRQRQNTGYEEALVIYFDEKPVVELCKGCYAVLVLPTGLHTFRGNDKESRIEQELKPGEEYYLGLASSKRSYRAHGRVSVVPREQALKELMDMLPIRPGIGIIKQKQLLAAEQAVPEVVARKQLIDAARDGNAEKVKSLVEGNAERVSVKDPKYGATPLHWAAGSNRKEVVAVLLANKADVNAETNEGLTALVLATDKGYTEVAELLLANGADPGFVGVEEIVLLPVVDSRGIQRTKVDLQKIRKYTQKYLEEKHYKVIQADSPPPGARWVLTITLSDLHQLEQASILPDVWASGSLVDQQTGVLRWKGLGTAGYRYKSVAEGFGDTFLVITRPGAGTTAEAEYGVSNLLKGIPRLYKK